MIRVHLEFVFKVRIHINGMLRSFHLTPIQIMDDPGGVSQSLCNVQYPSLGCYNIIS